MDNITKNAFLEVERALWPLKAKAGSLPIETKGGNVLSTMSLEDFFNLIDIGKRIEIAERYPEGQSKEVPSNPTDKEISDFLKEISGE